MKWLLELVVALAGCAGQAEPEPRTVRVEVPVPFRAPVVDVPAWAIASLRKGDRLQTKVRALLAELELRKEYEKNLEAAVQGCLYVSQP